MFSLSPRHLISWKEYTHFQVPVSVRVKGMKKWRVARTQKERERRYGREIGEKKDRKEREREGKERRCETLNEKIQVRSFIQERKWVSSLFFSLFLFLLFPTFLSLSSNVKFSQFFFRKKISKEGRKWFPDFRDGIDSRFLSLPFSRSCSLQRRGEQRKRKVFWRKQSSW